jgi:hypothetical protein
MGKPIPKRAIFNQRGKIEPHLRAEGDWNHEIIGVKNIRTSMDKDYVSFAANDIHIISTKSIFPFNLARLHFVPSSRR